MKKPYIHNAKGRNWNDIGDKSTYPGMLKALDQLKSFHYELENDEKTVRGESFADLEKYYNYMKDSFEGDESFRPTRLIITKNEDPSITYTLHLYGGMIDPKTFMTSILSDLGIDTKKTRTRDVVQYAYDNGYDGAIIKNVVDNGPFATDAFAAENANIYVVFDSNQIKAIDNKNPTDNDDIRFSLKDTGNKTDSEGITLSPGMYDFMRDSKALSRDGRLAKVYHGTTDAMFTVFYPSVSNYGGSFFTSNKIVGEIYTAEDGSYKEFNKDMTYEQRLKDLGATFYLEDDEDNLNPDWVVNYDGMDVSAGNTLEKAIDNSRQYYRELFDTADLPASTLYGVYLNLKNPLILECDEHDWDDLSYNGKDGLTTRDIADIAHENGNDGVIFRDIYDPEELSDVYIAFESNQVKAADNENPTDNEDIRYEIKEGMSDEERFDILKDKKLTVVYYDKEKLPLNEEDKET